MPQAIFLILYVLKEEYAAFFVNQQKYMYILA